MLVQDCHTNGLEYPTIAMRVTPLRGAAVPTRTLTSGTRRSSLLCAGMVRSWALGATGSGRMRISVLALFQCRQLSRLRLPRRGAFRNSRAGHALRMVRVVDLS